MAPVEGTKAHSDLRAELLGKAAADAGFRTRLVEDPMDMASHRPSWAASQVLRFVLAALLATAAAAGAAERLPNIVLLIGDDHGYPYFGFMGDRNVLTPNMDALAAGGFTFGSAHVTSSYCRPSLRSMITGLHPVQYVLRENELVERRRQEDARYAALDERSKRQWDVLQKAAAMREFDTLPSLLAKAGYVSWQGGKWWENSYETARFTEGMSTGWDMATFGEDAFFHEMMGGKGNRLVRETMAPVYDFIDRRKGDPLFIWFAPMLPHTPLDAPYSYAKLYQDKPLSESAKLYYANLSWWDHGVGQLMDFIESRGLLDDTLFIYLSDNGWEQDAEVEYKPADPDTGFHPLFATGGLKGKGALYDQSFRSPMVFYWKDRLRRGFNETSLVSSLDLLPTILDIVGQPVPEGLLGRSLAPLLFADRDAGEYVDREQIISYVDTRRSTTNAMGERAEGFYLRTPRWHFLWYRDSGEQALYDVLADPRSERDLANEQPELVARFTREIESWASAMGIEPGLEIHE